MASRCVTAAMRLLILVKMDVCRFEHITVPEVAAEGPAPGDPAASSVVTHRKNSRR
jgi:hypothetical protein